FVLKVTTGFNKTTSRLRSGLNKRSRFLGESVRSTEEYVIGPLRH
ncbi:hypothetical protein NPIL_210981, partial [Nephila pilipes]